VGSRCRVDGLHGHGLLALLLAHQHSLNLHMHMEHAHPLECQSLQHALLLALEALLACPAFPPHAVPAIAASGLFSSTRSLLALLCDLQGIQCKFGHG